ncbi:uncharacterized protein LOC143201475 isoform X2 [Rhynchophorus ferrugineus]|uniref:uncharacterized protein LOC143201475 isoform X2 n=1 Tax=Rhynchophorus ferrugineus TaxID=354439 RepID=UPI003FCCE732
MDIPVDDFKCTSCSKYLSIAPIYGSVDGTTNICGRCKPTSTLLRNALYEKIATSLKFPCSVSDKCKKILKWQEVENHEAMCPYRTVKCLFENCEDSFPEAEMETHFQLKGHPIIKAKGHNIALQLPWNNAKCSGYEVFLIKIVTTLPPANFTATIVGHDASIEFTKSLPIESYPGNNWIHQSYNNIIRHKVDKIGLFDLMGLADSASGMTVLLEVTLSDTNQYMPRNQCADNIRRSLSCSVCSKFLIGKCFLTNKGYSTCSTCSTNTVGRNYVIESLVEKLIKHHPELRDL